MYKELFVKNNRACRIFAFFAMCLLTLLCAAAAMRSDIFRDDTTCTIVTTNLFCLVFLTLLSGYYFLKGGTVGPMRYFTLFLLNHSH